MVRASGNRPIQATNQTHGLSAVNHSIYGKRLVSLTWQGLSRYH